MNNAAQRYQEAIKNIPPPGTGDGCHSFLLAVANYGVMAGVPPQELHDEIRRHIPQGGRRVGDKEIRETVDKALRDFGNGTFTPRPRSRPVVQDGKAALQNIISQGKVHADVDLWEASPIRLLDDPQDDPTLFLSTLYEPTDLVWIGDREQSGIIGETIRTVAEWIRHFEVGGKSGPHIIINPLTGCPAPKKSGDGETLRGDQNIAKFRYCLVEFDALTREDQLRFWSAVKLPIVALIDTGGKSIHGWLDVAQLAVVATPDEWAAKIKDNLYDRFLKPLGVDAACSNPARLSRLPGHFRTEKSKYQRLLWVSPEGRRIYP